MNGARLPGWLATAVRRIVTGQNSEFVLADLADDYARVRQRRSALAAGVRTLRLAAASRRVMHGGWNLKRCLAALAADSRFAGRSLRKHPGFTGVAVLTLALGIGANGAIFTVVRGVLLAPLPYSEPERLVNVWQVFRSWQNSEIAMFRAMADRFPASWPVYQQWRQRSRSFDSIAVYGYFPTIVDSLEVAEWVGLVTTTRSFVDVLGVQPALGRWFSETEDSVGGESVVVISHGYWQRMGGGPDVLGSTLRMHGDPYTVIGVMPEGFYFPDRAHDLWIPVPDSERNDRYSSQSMSAIGRLADGVELIDAQVEMDRVADQIIADEPDAIDAGVRLIGRVDEVAGSTAGTLRLLAAAVGLVLLVAAANVAGLLLVRTAGRRQELAVRAALGAKRARLVAHLCVEGTILAVAGGVVGLALVAVTLGGLRALLPADTPRVGDVVLNWQVAAFVAVVSLLVAVVFAVIAAAHQSRRDPAAGLRESSAVVAGSRGRALLVVGEIAVSVVLLAAAALLAGSYFRLASIESGFRADGLLSVGVAAPIDIWHSPPAELQSFFTEAGAALDALPGVVGAATVSHLPFGGRRSSGDFGLVEDPQAREDAGWSLEQNVSSRYFEVMGIPVLAGRALADAPGGTPEIVVNERLAGQYFPDGAVGELIWDDGIPHSIVGVVSNVAHGRLSEEIEAKRYRLFSHRNDATASFVLRIDGAATAVAASARELLTGLRPGTTVSDIASMNELISRTTALPRFRTLLLAALAGLAILLAAIGLYGVVAFAVTARRREFGLRMTLGAGAYQVARLVVVDGARLTVPGIVLGLAGALAATSWLSSYLYAVEPRDPLILALVVLAVAALAFTAMALPARRALRVDPMVALRND